MYKKEVEQFVKGFTIKDIKLHKGTVECLFENNNGEIIYLDISLKENVLIKKKDNLIEYVKIDNNLLLVHEIIEKRPSGIVYSINLGLLTPDSYNLKALRGITDKEDSIV